MEHRPPRHVVVTGSESTGKTTLAAALAERLGGTFVSEYAREYAMKVGRPLDVQDVGPIARGQLAREDGARASARGPVIFDTDLVSTVVYATHYYGNCPDWIDEAARARLAPLYLLCDIDLPWVADGVRDRPATRAAMHEAFVATLARYGAQVAVVRGERETRFQCALRALPASLT